jgi:hypothetical protein
MLASTDMSRANPIFHPTHGWPSTLSIDWIPTTCLLEGYEVVALIFYLSGDHLYDFLVDDVSMEAVAKEIILY